MIELTDRRGHVCAKLDLISLDGSLYALPVRWIPDALGEPDPVEWTAAFRKLIEEARGKGARAIDTRVSRMQSNVEYNLTTMRANAFEAILRGLGFVQTEGRVEFRVPLPIAIRMLERVAKPPRLTWIQVATEPGPEIERAARVLDAVAVGDPNSSPDDDALGFLLSRRQDDQLALTPEAVQIGVLDGKDVAVIAVSVMPDSGWCSHSYLGVIPELRRQGLGVEAMLHGLYAMRTLGGLQYQDGTGSRNEAALALFRIIDTDPDSVMEEWRLSL